ncbi:hypothetical protein F3Y22_tig00111099pilonHSYRG00089 [Hibiscus syriacus]|uniref:Uncharacterized protein n=1 Tax=Hibiscus syriacus TaxID=106335 RepID=A0A6A2Z1C9_HIBSY|nr:hypothetical protein F3Y22_tig00111099pilonHSYRG00089 [Hibiscus syriacus]
MLGQSHLRFWSKKVNGSGQRSGRVNGRVGSGQTGQTDSDRSNRSEPVKPVRTDTYNDRFKFLNGGELDFKSAESLTAPPPHAPPSTADKVDTGELGTAQGTRWCGRCRKRSNDQRRTTHSGVLEFTADEGSVAIPPHVWSNLFPVDTPMVPLVEVRYVRLPKDTYAKFQPDGIGFSDLPNHKAILETSFRQHATLFQDDVLTVKYGELTYSLHVLELKPSSSISVLETDIEVDIVNPGVESDRTDQYVLKPLVFGTIESGSVEEGNYMYYKFSIDDDTWETIVSDDVKIEVKIDAEILTFMNLGTGTYSLAVYGFKGTTKYQVSVHVQENSKCKAGKQAMHSSSMEVDTEECRNCKHFIPSRSIAPHEAYCSRHNVVCPLAGCGIVLRMKEAKNHVHCNKCGQAFQSGEMEKHMKVFHEPLRCPCGVVLEKEDMVQHQAPDCPLRLITCRFCGDMVQAGSSAMDVRDRLRGLSEHESICGSRTAPCDSRGRSVMLKDMDIHQIAVHPKN